jgi:hypothetical protein
MSQTQPARAPAPDLLHEPPRETFDLRKLVTGYFWFILKNVIGWLCILFSPILGVLVPGPGGIPIFLIGFALVTFPGKRRLTTRFMRGGQLPIESALFTGIITFFSVAVTGTLMILAWQHFEWLEEQVPLQEWGLGDVAQVVAISLLALPVTMLVSWVALKVLNTVLGWVPRLRRMIRPAMRKWGVRLLPTRRRRVGGRTELVHDEILGLEEGQRQRLRRFWLQYGPWVTRLATVSLTIGIIYMVVVPVIQQWGWVEQRIGQVESTRLVLAVVMFALGLLIFRAATWRMILSAVGQPIPLTAAARIWSLGHLARFIPGRLDQILRIEMAHPYGPSGVQAGVANRLEGALSLASAIVIGLAAFWISAYERAPEGWRPLLIAAAGLAPLVLLLTAPSIFYRLVPTSSGLWRRTGERTRVAGPWLLVMFLWLTLGMFWQGTAVWLLVGPPLQGKLWVVAGAWALAWAAGHLAPWSPGGLGVREVVFVGVLSVLLPRSLRESFAVSVPFTLWSPGSWQDVWWAFLFFLALLLRITTTASEFLLAVTTTLADWRGMRRMLHS